MTSADGQWFPPEWPVRVAAMVRGELVPAVPRRAATVMLLRDAAAGPPQVYLLRRRASMAFAGGAYAYPGGSVDTRDAGELGWAGPDRAQWARRLGVDEESAQTIVCAAVRETFEESGVLLAGPSAREVVSDTTGAAWEADRTALAARELSLAGLLERRGLVLRSDLLAAWSRWITPEFEPRRFDTWFFVAALPHGQRTRNASTEADRAAWTGPRAAIGGYERGELTMMPPTIATLRELAPYPAAAAALAAAAGRAPAVPVQARARREGGRLVVSWPGYEEFEIRMPARPGEAAGGTPDAAPGTAGETSEETSLPAEPAGEQGERADE